ncbi:(R)-2-hydroxyglutaryl-CoA dehydratase activator [Klebsiella variicola]|uniref:(R)-2-hydroxyglutaryl-CoA dehydratase activator n=1 Tax=Klebsiella variicola TaxID=244366 RepID=A0A7H4MCQ1_KLEVA|nr:(R)-2-hydroxyglutaryl-CoA dehydratase activator [Klebsiella variicola]
MNYTVGIDSGSTATKGILLADGVIVRRFLCPTPFRPADAIHKPGKRYALASRRRLF